MPTNAVTRTADIAGTLVFAIEGGLTGLGVGLDPVGILALAFLTGLGGGLIRDVLIGSLPPAAIRDWHYAVTVVAAATIVWLVHPALLSLPPGLMVALDAAGLAFAAIAGTEKALEHGIHPFVCVFLGTVSGAGGGTLRDVVINQVPRVLRTDIYGSAAACAAIIIVIGRALGWPARATAILAGLACFGLRLLAYRHGWHLPTLG
ncbi:TRIC cation channel family protein [Sphingomonas sp.]|uniref:trimeric intracellular cation channel family protein n=1 Tax=Sphingomonas sp. TaxID=28214 RepID=UPI0025FCC496|nr:TRIC cation channel family protein [Sphingomonas sp.]